MTHEQREALRRLPCRTPGANWYDLGLWRLGLITTVWGDDEDSDCIMGYDLTDAGRAAINIQLRNV